MSEPEANERGSSLIGKNHIIGALNHFFLPNARNCGYVRMKHLGCAMDSQGIFGYARMKHLGCAMDSQGILVMLEWEI